MSDLRKIPVSIGNLLRCIVEYAAKAAFGEYGILVQILSLVLLLVSWLAITAGMLVAFSALVTIASFVMAPIFLISVAFAILFSFLTPWLFPAKGPFERIQNIVFGTIGVFGGWISGIIAVGAIIWLIGLFIPMGYFN